MDTHFETEIGRLKLKVMVPETDQVELRIHPKPIPPAIFPTFDESRTANQAFGVQKELSQIIGENRITIKPGLDHRRVLISPRAGQNTASLLDEVVGAVKDIITKEHVIIAGKQIREDDGKTFLRFLLERYRNKEIDYERGFAEILEDEHLTADARRKAFNALKEEQKRQMGG